MLSVATVRGLWQRSLIVWPDGARDGTTDVRWLQGPSFYIDLRRPAGRPDFAAVSCLDDLDRDQVLWLAGQEGFAGELVFDGRCFEWRREFDLQPVTPYSDAGFLRFDGDVLVEEGRDVAYVEHWHRDKEATLPAAAARLIGADGRIGFIVRVGDRFMFARDRGVPLGAGETLGDLVADAGDMAAALALIDCEISYGTIDESGWTIGHSSLPFREGARLAPVTAHGGAGLVTTGVAADGGRADHVWRIETLQGVLTDLVDFTALRPTTLAR
ncbi:hypothetical protein L2U69_01725 [Zavarzinia compransoris]|uniref:hypothetical protein n=1 Tax=Zavarzinia marina TaxID=2911065 RepID=UPI001F2D6D80|nr:hypothetical protein [Zavarzinia marina]MCF4164365.1 hypothetical protein [Zavarzinia marina]